MTSTTKHAAETASTRRKRRWWRWPLRMFLVGFIVFACWLGSWVYWAYTVEPNPTVDYAAKLEQLARDAQPEGENGWPLIEEAIAIFERMDEEFPQEERPYWHKRTIDLFGVLKPSFDLDTLSLIEPEATSTDETIEYARRALQWLRDEGVFELLASVGDRPVIVPVDHSNDMLIGRLQPHLARSQQISRAAAASVYVAVAEGEWDQASMAIDCATSLALAYTKQGTLIDHLVGYAILGLVKSTIIDLALANDLEPQQFRDLGNKVERFGECGDPRVAINGERFVLLDAVQHTFSDDGKGGGYYLPAVAEGEPAGGLLNLNAIVGPKRRDAEALLNSILDGFIEASQLPFDERPGRIREVEAPLKTPMNSTERLVGVLMPTIGGVIDQFELANHHAAALKIFLAIEDYRVDHGTPPESLQDLVPAYVDAIMPDPLNGRAFGYRLRDHPVARNGYLLYSFGRDGTDNDGNYDVGAPNQGLRRTENDGVDVLINVVSWDIEAGRRN